MDVYNLKNNISCKLRVVPEQDQDVPAHFIVDRLEVSFRECYASRRDMWMIQNDLSGKTVYKGK